MADEPAEPKHGDAIAEGIGLAQLVGDEDDGDAALGQPPHHLPQLLHARGRQHGGRLVQDQHALVAPERAHDLDLLLLAEREIADR